MNTLYRAYTSTHEAEDAIERLLAAGLPETDIQLIMGVGSRDARDALIGTWAGTTTTDALIVGSYASIKRASSTPAARRWARSPGTATSYAPARSATSIETPSRPTSRG